MKTLTLLTFNGRLPLTNSFPVYSIARTVFHPLKVLLVQRANQKLGGKRSSRFPPESSHPASFDYQAGGHFQAAQRAQRLREDSERRNWLAPSLEPFFAIPHANPTGQSNDDCPSWTPPLSLHHLLPLCVSCFIVSFIIPFLSVPPPSPIPHRPHPPSTPRDCALAPLRKQSFLISLLEPTCAFVPRFFLGGRYHLVRSITHYPHSTAMVNADFLP